MVGFRLMKYVMQEEVQMRILQCSNTQCLEHWAERGLRNSQAGSNQASLIRRLWSQCHGFDVRKWERCRHHVQGGASAGDDQHLFSMYVHDKPGSPGYRPGDVYLGHRIYERVKVRYLGWVVTYLCDSSYLCVLPGRKAEDADTAVSC